MENEKINIKKTIILLVLAVLLGHLGGKYLIGPCKIVGESMEPNYLNNQMVFANKAAINIVHKKPKRGDVVIIDGPKIDFFPPSKIIKRVIGLPGEEIEIKPDSSVFINGDLLKEEYLDEVAKSNTYTEHYEIFYSQNLKIKLKDDEYFYMGDNRSNSFDSRTVGPCKYSKIEGIVITKKLKN